MTQKEHGLSIEHVMPQTLTESWKRALGDDWESVYSTWKNRIANLTLTGYNSKYSNRPFSEKLDMEDGFRDSHLYLNKWISEQSEWGEEQLAEREDLLVKRFLKLWPMPETAFVPTVRGVATYDLDDGFDFTGSSIISFTFMGERKAASTWKAAVEEILRELYDLDPASIRSLALEKAFPGSYFRVGGDEGDGWFRIGTDCFAYLSTSTASKISILAEVFKRLGLDCDDLAFEVKTGEPGSEE